MYEEFIGLSLEEATLKAKSYSMHIRITYKDGEHMFLTEDRQLFRLNLHIENNKVIKAYRG